MGLICSLRNMDSKSYNKIERWFVKLQITFLFPPGMLHDIEKLLNPSGTKGGSKTTPPRFFLCSIC